MATGCLRLFGVLEYIFDRPRRACAELELVTPGCVTAAKLLPQRWRMRRAATINTSTSKHQEASLSSEELKIRRHCADLGAVAVPAASPRYFHGERRAREGERRTPRQRTGDSFRRGKIIFAASRRSVAPRHLVGPGQGRLPPCPLAAQSPSSPWCGGASRWLPPRLRRREKRRPLRAKLRRRDDAWSRPRWVPR